MTRKIDLGITGITSEDGLCQLTHGGYDSTRDGGGELLTFSLAFEDEKQEMYDGVILVADNTGYFTREYYKNTDIEFSELSLTNQRQLIEEFGEKFGKYFYLKWFQQLKFDLQALPDEKTIRIGCKLCELYLKRYSNYPQNNRDWRADPKAYYHDKILFQPIILEGGHVSPECFFEMTAEEAFSIG